MTLDQHVSAVRHHGTKAMDALVAALRTDKALAEEARQRVAQCRAVEEKRGAGACWITTKTKETLTVALTAMKAKPDVPAGG